MNSWNLKPGGTLARSVTERGANSAPLTSTQAGAARTAKPWQHEECVMHQAQTKPYQASTKRQRAALTLVALVTTASLLSGVVALFETVQPGPVFAGPLLVPAGPATACVDNGCDRQLASVTTKAVAATPAQKPARLGG